MQTQLDDDISLLTTVSSITPVQKENLFNTIKDTKLLCSLLGIWSSHDKFSMEA